MFKQHFQSSFRFMILFCIDVIKKNKLAKLYAQTIGVKRFWKCVEWEYSYYKLKRDCHRILWSGDVIFTHRNGFLQ